MSSRSRPRPEPQDDWRISPISLVLAGAIRAIASTVDFRFHNEAELRGRERAGAAFILAFWHRHLVLMRYAYRGRRMSVLVSQSWDGELTSRTLERLGCETVRGSTSKGGAMAMREVLRRAREGSDLAFTPDGPRGPAHVVQPGVVVAGAMTGLPVVPVAIGASRAKLLRSWDRMMVPLPGSRVEVVYGDPLAFDRAEPVENAALRLREEMLAIERRADELAKERH